MTETTRKWVRGIWEGNMMGTGGPRLRLSAYYCKEDQIIVTWPTASIKRVNQYNPDWKAFYKPYNDNSFHEPDFYSDTFDQIFNVFLLTGEWS